jgi:hypothetical protein
MQGELNGRIQRMQMKKDPDNLKKSSMVLDQHEGPSIPTVEAYLLTLSLGPLGTIGVGAGPLVTI